MRSDGNWLESTDAVIGGGKFSGSGEADVAKKENPDAADEFCDGCCTKSTNTPHVTG